MSEHQIQLTVNGQPIAARVEARLTLADFLRVELGYTGLHLAVQADGADVVTVEGVATDPDGALHPVQQAMRACHALQCGFCTPGVVMTLVSLTKDGQTPDEETLMAAMSGHLCRCTGYQGIRRAVRMLTGDKTIGEQA
jgi:carbon-monoxide dehydrogenase small subunit